MKRETKQRIRKTGIVLFVCYVILLIYFLFFSEDYGRIPWEGRGYRYNLIPFVEIHRFWVNRGTLGNLAVVTNLLGNIVGFLPYGFMLPVICPRMRNGFLITLSGAAVCFSVEVIQLITRVGIFDVDDMILNTLGTWIGYLMFAVCDRIRRKYDGKKI